MKWAIKGNIVYTIKSSELTIVENGIIVCEDDKIIGVFETLPKKFEGIKITDYGDKLIMPGLNDLHVHAPQYRFRGTGMDIELLDWLETYTFPEEAKFIELNYAKKSYFKFVNDLKKSPTTRASIFATIHAEATIELMNLLEDSGLVTYVGKVNMNQNSPDNLKEKDAETSLRNTVEWLDAIVGKYNNTYPIITPRFVPSCDGKLLDMLGDLSNSYHLPNQSHLSENPSEINLVLKCEPNSKFYGDAYYMHNLFGGKNRTIMAHCVYSGDEEIELIRKQGVYIAHCPTSNINLSSGIAPVRKYLDIGLKIGLGSDIAGGHSLSIFKAMADAIQVSKLRWRLLDDGLKPLKVSEAFYMATKGGGAFFGKVGSFEENYEMDAIVIDDTGINDLYSYSIENRLERVIYLDNEIKLISKYVRGKKIF